MLMNKLLTKSIFLRSQFKSVRRIKEITCKSIKVAKEYIKFYRDLNP
jgi:hypothetical protein